MAETDEFSQEQPETSAQPEPEMVEITPGGEDETLKAKAEAVAAQQRLKEIVERAQNDADAGRDVAAEYESKYYGAPARAGEPPKAVVQPDVPQPPVMSRVPPPPPPLPIPAEETQDRSMPLTDSDERLWAALAHASLIVTLLATPFSVGTLTLFLIFVPLIIYFAYRERSEFVAYHALQGFAMQVFATIGWVALGLAITIAFVIAIVISGVLSIVLIGIPFLLLSVVGLVLFWLVWICLPIGLGIYSLMAAWETYHGRNFRYVKLADWVDRFLVNYI
ncbi:MAG: DUF4870 domain-containing protein [Anaerolineae bacterium]|nr:DUF4870 domain-containing protein [Anaerolineae bacterium]